MARIVANGDYIAQLGPIKEDRYYNKIHQSLACGGAMQNHLLSIGYLNENILHDNGPQWDRRGEQHLQPHYMVPSSRSLQTKW